MTTDKELNLAWMVADKYKKQYEALESRLSQLQAELVAINKGAETNIHLARSTSDENKKLKAELAALHKATDLVQHVANSETQEVVRLQAENARYRGALARIVGHRRTIHQAEYNFAKGMEHIAQSALRPVGTEGPKKCFYGGSDQAGHIPTLGHDTHRPPEQGEGGGK